MTLDPLSFLLGVATALGVILALAFLERWLDKRAGPPHQLPRD